MPPRLDGLRGKTFRMPIEVLDSHIDELGHVNNQIYLNWFMKGAIEHSRSVGLGLEKYREMGGVFVVRRNEVVYHRPAHQGDRLVLETWSTPVSRVQSRRHYELVREGDNRLIASGETD